jgi:hypothetical protein
MHFSPYHAYYTFRSPTFLDIILLITDKEYKLWRSLCGVLQFLVSSSLLGLHICLGTLLSNAFSLCSLLDSRDQISQQFSTAGKIIVLYILIVYCVLNKVRSKRRTVWGLRFSRRLVWRRFFGVLAPYSFVGLPSSNNIGPPLPSIVISGLKMETVTFLRKRHRLTKLGRANTPPPPTHTQKSLEVFAFRKIKT